MIHFYDEIPIKSYFIGSKSKKNNSIENGHICNALGRVRTKSLLALHAISGTDMSGKFAGRSKEICLKIFLSASYEIVSAVNEMNNTNID